MEQLAVPDLFWNSKWRKIISPCCVEAPKWSAPWKQRGERNRDSSSLGLTCLSPSWLLLCSLLKCWFEPLSRGYTDLSILTFSASFYLLRNLEYIWVAAQRYTRLWSLNSLFRSLGPMLNPGDRSWSTILFPLLKSVPFEDRVCWAAPHRPVRLVVAQPRGQRKSPETATGTSMVYWVGDITRPQ